MNKIFENALGGTTPGGSVTVLLVLSGVGLSSRHSWSPVELTSTFSHTHTHRPRQCSGETGQLSMTGAEPRGGGEKLEKKKKKKKKCIDRQTALPCMLKRHLQQLSSKTAQSSIYTHKPTHIHITHTHTPITPPTTTTVISPAYFTVQQQPAAAAWTYTPAECMFGWVSLKHFSRKKPSAGRRSAAVIHFHLF